MIAKITKKLIEFELIEIELIEIELEIYSPWIKIIHTNKSTFDIVPSSQWRVR